MTRIIVFKLDFSEYFRKILGILKRVWSVYPPYGKCNAVFQQQVPQRLPDVRSGNAGGNCVSQVRLFFYGRGEQNYGQIAEAHLCFGNYRQNHIFM